MRVLWADRNQSLPDKSAWKTRRVTEPRRNLGKQSSDPKEQKGPAAERGYWGCKRDNHHLSHGSCRADFGGRQKWNEKQPDIQGTTPMEQGLPNLRRCKGSTLTEIAVLERFPLWYFCGIYSISILAFFLKGGKKGAKQWFVLNPLESSVCSWNTVLALHNASNSEWGYAGAFLISPFPLIRQYFKSTYQN